METNEVNLQVKDINQQGVALAKAGNIDAVIEKFNKALELDPMLIDTYKNLGDLYLILINMWRLKTFIRRPY